MKKINWLIILLGFCVTAFTGCATSNRTPDLQSFQSPTLPTGGSDAAQTANTL